MAVWHGTKADLLRLDDAIRRNCTCDPDKPDELCAAHKMLVDQTTLDHLAFVVSHNDVYREKETQSG